MVDFLDEKFKGKFTTSAENVTRAKKSKNLKGRSRILVSLTVNAVNYLFRTSLSESFSKENVR